MAHTRVIKLLLCSLCLSWSISIHAQPPPEKVEVNGIVLHGVTNRPVVGAAVRAQRQWNDRQPPQTQQLSTQTDARGRFALKKVDEGKYNLSVNKRGFVATTVVVEIGLHPEDITIKLNPLTRVKGTIYRPVGSPLANSEVTFLAYHLEVERNREIWKENWGGTGTARTDPSGHYQVSVDTGNKFRLFVRAPGVGFGTSSECEVKIGKAVESVEIRLTEGETLVVKVTDEKTGAPVIGANVTTYLRFEFPFLGYLVESQGTFTDGEGKVSIKGATPGPYRVSVLSPGYYGQSNDCVLDFPGHREEPLTVPLSPLPGAVSFSGRVLLKEGAKVVRNSRLQLGFAAVVKDQPWTEVIVSETRTDDQGLFRSLLPASGKDWMIWARVPGTGSALVGPLPVDQNAKEMKGIDLALEPGTTLRILVRDEEGRGLPGIKVHVGAYLTPTVLTIWDLWPPVPQTDAEGRLQCADLFAGNYFVNVEPQEFGGTCLFHFVALKQREPNPEIIFDLFKGVEVSGKILQAERQLPFGGVPFQVCAVSRPSSPFQVLGMDNAQTQLDGSFVLPHVIRTKGYLLFLAGDAGLAFTELLDLTTAEEVAGLELALQPGGRISGIARREGKPAVNVWVYAHARQPDGSASMALCYATTTKDGRFNLAGLPPGEYVVSTESQPSKPPVKFLKVVVGQTVETEVEAP